MSLEFMNRPEAAVYGARDAHINELTYLEETIEEIDSALQADDFYRGDRREVMRSREFFESRRSQLERILAEGSLFSTQRAL